MGMFVATTPAVGDVAPDFTTQDIDGNTITLSKAVESGPVILAFYPAAFTGGCTREMKSYRDRYDEIKKLKGRVWAVSTDDVETLKRWRDELKAPQTFIADPEGRLVKLYDTKMPVVKTASRRTWVIGKGLKVLGVSEGMDAIDTTKSVAACTQVTGKAEGAHSAETPVLNSPPSKTDVTKSPTAPK